MEKLILTYVCEDALGALVYKSEDGKFFKDINLGIGMTDLHTCNDIDDDPDTPIDKVKKYSGMEIVLVGRDNGTTEEEKFRYQLLDRLRMDCDYYLGNGRIYGNHLWAETESGQIAKMKELWSSFADDKKPEWLTWEAILDYEKQMVK